MTGDAKTTIEKLLSQPFSESDLRWRVGRSGISNGKPWALILAYIDSRDVMNRLDEVVGIDGWQDKITETASSVYICELSVKIGDKWITKTDGAEKTQIEGGKGGISDSFKRTAVKFGIGRYLYNIKKVFAVFCDKRDGLYEAKINDKKYYWHPPSNYNDNQTDSPGTQQGNGPGSTTQNSNEDGITEPQINAVYNAAYANFDLSHDQSLTLSAEIVCRHLKEIKELTKAEASKLIKDINDKTDEVSRIANTLLR